MLGTHSKLRRGQMSHICDISALRVNNPSANNQFCIYGDCLLIITTPTNICASNMSSSVMYAVITTYKTYNLNYSLQCTNHCWVSLTW